jgi:hypothetical protein
MMQTAATEKVRVVFNRSQSIRPIATFHALLEKA